MAQSSSRATVGSRFSVLATTSIVIALLYFGREILIPLALATLIVFVLAPAETWLERLKLNRGVASTIIVGLALAAVCGLGYVVFSQFTAVIEQLPHYGSEIQHKLSGVTHKISPIKKVQGELGKMVAPATSQAASQPSTTQPAPSVGPPPTAGGNIGGSGNADDGLIEKPRLNLLPAPPPQPTTAPANQAPVPVTVVSQAQSPYDVAGEWALRVLSPLATAGIVAGFVIFILIAREDLRDRVLRLFGNSRLNITTQAIDEATRRITRYLVAQSLVNACYGVAVAAGLWLIGRIWGHSDGGDGFPNILLWAMLCALLRFVPYVGIWIAMVLPVALSFALFKGNAVFFATLSMFVIFEISVSQFVEPFVYGSSTGMSALAVLVAAVFWTAIWGPIGLLLSTPLTVCLVVIGKYVPQLKFLDILLSDEQVLEAPVRLYQRLIALDQEEAAEVAETFLQDHSLEQTYDQLLLPALALASRDHYHDQLDDHRLEFVQQGIRELIEETAERYQIAQTQKAAADAEKQIREGTVAPAVEENKRTQLPRGCTVNVLCLPARDTADELAAMMLAQLLKSRGFCAESVGADRLAGEMMDQIERDGAHVVCVSALPPAAVSHARYLCKRVHARFEDIRMLVGLWTTEADLTKAKNRLTCAAAVDLVTTLADAQHCIDQMSQHVVTETVAAGLPAQV